MTQQKSKWLKMTQHDSTWLNMTQHDSTWHHIIPGTARGRWPVPWSWCSLCWAGAWPPGLMWSSPADLTPWHTSRYRYVTSSLLGMREESIIMWLYRDRRQLYTQYCSSRFLYSVIYLKFCLFSLFICFLSTGQQVVQHAAEEGPGAGHSRTVGGGGKHCQTIRCDE